MLRLGLVLLSAALLAPASAAAFDETSPLAVKGRADCMRPTGAPGEVMTSNHSGARFLHASRDGLVTGETVRLGGAVYSCAAADGRPNGAGVVAAAPETRGVYAAVREPGGTWGAAVAVAERDDWWSEEVAVAVSDRGDAIVVWTEVRVGDSGPGNSRVRVARRPPGGTFGAPEVLAGTPVDALTTGIAATGDAVVLWTTRERTRAPQRDAVMVATATGGAPFAPATRVGDLRRHSTASLAVAQDGHALVALADGEALLVAERAPGATFGAPARVGEARDPLGVQTSAALATGGAAAVAWSGAGLGGVGIITRAGPGAFAPSRTLVAGEPRITYDVYEGILGAIVPKPAGSWVYGGAAPRASLTGDGRALVSWTGPQADRGVTRRRAHLAAVPLDGRPVVSHTAGGALEDVQNVHGLVLADGTPAVVWTDDPVDAPIGYRLRLAADGASAPAAAPPRVRVGSPASRMVKDNWLVLPVSCGSPCEVSGRVAGASNAGGVLRLDRAGSGRLWLEAYGAPIAPRRLGRVRIRLSVSARGGVQVAKRTLALRLVRPADPPPAPLRALRAVRRGDTIRVSWHVDRPVADIGIAVTGSTSPAWTVEPVVSTAIGAARTGQSSFSATLRGAKGVRWVTIRGIGAPVPIRVR